MASRKSNRRHRLKRLVEREHKMKCDIYTVPRQGTEPRFFQKMPRPLPKGQAKLDRQASGHRVVRTDAHHVQILPRNFKSAGEYVDRDTPNRLALVVRAFNKAGTPYEHLTFNRIGAVLNKITVKKKNRLLA